jgi:hypothetical protein
MSFNRNNASICDSGGNLLFYTNGIAIYDATHQMMENGDSLSPIGLTQTYSNAGLLFRQGAVLLPYPGRDSLYFAFHQALDFDFSGGIGYHNQALFYSVINNNFNEGKGAVIEKNKMLVFDTLASGKLTATKHANGRDWWLLVPEWDKTTQGFYQYLITPQGITNLEKQYPGPNIHYTAPSIGQAVFSPDGSKYVRHDIRFEPWSAVNIYDFDRCTGELSLLEYFEMVDTAFLTGGAVVSPDSRYLYTIVNDFIYQFDLLADDIEASKKLAAEFDGYIAYWFDSNFSVGQLAISSPTCGVVKVFIKN